MYCVVDDIKKEVTEKTLKELTNDNQPATSIDTAIVNNYISSNEVLINTYLKKVANLPITDTDDLLIIKKISIDLTVCDLFERRLQTELIETRRTNAIKLLENISKGILAINSKIPSKGSQPFVKSGKYTPLFDTRFRTV